jgi:hypothetical protein
MALIEQYELVKEMRFVFDNVEPTIEGRIYRIVQGANAKYTWEINYYCRLESEAGVYTPSAPFGNTLDEVEHKLLQYVKRFEKAADWQENELY